MLYLRKTILFSFIAIYLIFCPLLILYSFGRILKPGGDGNSAGLIFLSSSPSGATVYVEGRKFSEKTPTALKGMLPGAYNITLSLENYNPWHKELQALPRLAAVFDKILLTPEDWKTQEITTDSFQKLIPIAKSRFFLLAKGSKLRDYYSFDSKTEELRPFASSTLNFASWDVVSLFKVPASSTVIAKIRAFREDKYILIEQEKDYINVKDVSRFFPGRPEYILWDSEQPDYVFSFENNKLNKIDLVNQSLETDYLENLRGYGLFNNRIYVLKDINTLFRVGYDRSNQKVLLNDPILGNFLFGREGFFEVKPLDGNIIIFLGKGGKLVNNRLPYRITEKGVRGLEFHRQSKRVLFWMKNQSGIIDYRPLFSSEPTTAKNRPAKGYFFYTEGKDITQAFWAYQGNYIVLNDSDRAFIFELKAGEEASPNRIVKIKTGSLVHYLESSGKLYYLDPLTRRLNYAEVIDQDQERPLSFKEYLRKER